MKTRVVMGAGLDFDAAAGGPRLQLEHVARAHERRDERRIRPVVDLLGRAELGDAAGVEDGDAIGHHHRFLAVVRDVDRGDAELRLQGLDLVAHLFADARVEVRKRLVEQQQLRADGERAAERHALALAAGELGHVALAEALELEHRQDLVDALGDVGLGDRGAA